MKVVRILLVFGVSIAIGLSGTAGSGLQDAEPFLEKQAFVGEVFAGSYAPDGRQFYFFQRVTRETEDYRIYVSRNERGRWSEPERLNLDGEYSDLYPVITPDGSYLLFASYRPRPGETEPAPLTDIWISRRTDDSWSKPQHAPHLSDAEKYEAGLQLGPCGQLYFRSSTADFSETETRVAVYLGDGRFSEPERFKAIDVARAQLPDYYIWGGYMEPGGRFLVLDVSARSSESGRPTASDIWIALSEPDGKWGQPLRLPEGINSDTFDNFVHFTPDGKVMGFVRGFREFYRVPVAKFYDRRD